ncbi:GntR family transcriptional regulator [Pseudooceanicola nanhaiensis]|uniref:GntR family transcriptional regulator n=1 Tax=Pseudooceanicola nanhaiensis TaxID=375761 RepID=UPI004057F4B0
MKRNLAISISRPRGRSSGEEAGGAIRFRHGLRPRTIAEPIADTCGVMIVEGRLAPGDRVGEEKLAEMYRVSRGPVREAIRILEKRRLVDIIPRRGAFVRAITLDSIADLFNVRNALAAMAVETVTRRAARQEKDPTLLKLERRRAQLARMAEDPACSPLDFSFQLTRIVYTLISGSGNRLLGEIWTELNEHTFWTAIWRTPQDGLTHEERQARYAQVNATVELVRAGQVPEAAASLRTWMDEIRDRVLQNLA